MSKTKYLVKMLFVKKKKKMIINICVQFAIPKL